MSLSPGPVDHPCNRTSRGRGFELPGCGLEPNLLPDRRNEAYAVNEQTGGCLGNLIEPVATRGALATLSEA